MYNAPKRVSPIIKPPNPQLPRDRRMLSGGLMPPEKSIRQDMTPSPVKENNLMKPDAPAETCPPAPEAAHGEEKKSPWQRFKSILSSFNPKTIFYDRPREDIAAYRKARSIRDSDIAAHPEAVRAKIDLKFLGALAVSEIAGTCFGAPTFGMILQEATHNAYLGVVGTVVGDYFPAVFAFQAAWLALNVDFYKHRAKTFAGRVREFYKDVMPIHAAAVLASIPAYAVGSAISAAIIFGINKFTNSGAEKMRIMPIISEIVNFGFVETIYLDLLGSGVASGVSRIAERFSQYLEKRFGANQPNGCAGCESK
jgi:hypothetical protein